MEFREPENVQEKAQLFIGIGISISFQTTQIGLL